MFAKDTPEFRLYLKQNLYELACFATDKKMKDIWFCGSGSTADKVKRSLGLAEALEDMSSRINDEAMLLSEYTVYVCLQGYVKRFGAEEAGAEVLAERRKSVADACNVLAERDASMKAYIAKRYGSEKLS